MLLQLNVRTHQKIGFNLIYTLGYNFYIIYDTHTQVDANEPLNSAQQQKYDKKKELVAALEKLTLS